MRRTRSRCPSWGFARKPDMVITAVVMSRRPRDTDQDPSNETIAALSAPASMKQSVLRWTFSRSRFAPSCCREEGELATMCPVVGKPTKGEITFELLH